jgi:hypothetical protein
LLRDRLDARPLLCGERLALERKLGDAAMVMEPPEFQAALEPLSGHLAFRHEPSADAVRDDRDDEARLEAGTGVRRRGLRPVRSIALTGAKGPVWISGNREIVFPAIRNRVENANHRTPPGTMGGSHLVHGRLRWYR